MGKGMTMIPRHVIIGTALVLGCQPAAAQSDALYKDPAQPVAARVDDLIGRMTLEEKVAQLLTIWEDKPAIMSRRGVFDPDKASAVMPHGLGQIARPSDMRGLGRAGIDPNRGPADTVAFVNAAQRWAAERTRLGIPFLFHEEGLHGFQARGATHFPQAIALASTWDPALIERVYAIVGREIRVRGAHLALTPVIDVARDPRWGRIEETYGEDPYLVGEMGVAAIRGFQGDSLPLGPGRVLATLKHMTGHGQPESGTNIGPAQIAERTLREVFLPPFEQAVRRTAVQSVMASYNEIDGVPSHASGWLLNDVLRGEWGFEGAVVSDYGGIHELMTRHGVVASLDEAAVATLNAGVDAEMPDGNAFLTLVDLVRSGRLDEAVIDRSVRRMLSLKFHAGLFETPYADAEEAERLTDNAEARALAEEVARKAIILLKNDGVLPLDAGAIDRLAVIGPNAAEAILGGYSDVPRRTISILDGIRAKVGDRVRIDYAEGVRITEGHNWWVDEVRLADPKRNARRIDKAVKVAARADAIVLVIGGNEHTSREAWVETHLGDRTSLGLVGEQQALADALLDLGKPVVVVLINGRPLAIPELAERAPAILEGWYLGQEGGTAMADVLFGDANPGGKLPVSIPRSVGHVPVFYNHKPTARRGYLFDTTEPLWPFGFGLSYTSFELSDLTLDRDRVAPDGTVEVSVDVTNTGPVAGDEVVQLYIRDRVASVTRPVKELKGFKRVTLAPGETATVRFTLTAEHLALWDRSMARVVEPGLFDVMVGPNSADLITTAFEVTGP